MTEQTDYTITLQRIIEAICKGHPLPTDSWEKAPHHAAMVETYLGTTFSQAPLVGDEIPEPVRSEIEAARETVKQGPDARFYNLSRIIVWLADRLASQHLELSELRKEVETWRWLHWGKDASWACKCGHAHGSAVARCEECGIEQPDTLERTMSRRHIPLVSPEGSRDEKDG